MFISWKGGGGCEIIWRGFFVSIYDHHDLHEVNIRPENQLINNNNSVFQENLKIIPAFRKVLKTKYVMNYKNLDTDW